MFFVKVFFGVAWFGVCCFIEMLVALIRWRHPSNNFVFSYLFSRVISQVLGIRLDVKNGDRVKKCQPCVYIGNHRNNLDIVTHGYCNPPRTICIGKWQLLMIPVFGLFFYLNGNILINRKNHEKAIKGLEKAKRALCKRNISIFMFPEGTRNPSDKLLPFKKGAFHLAMAAGAPLLPIVASPIEPLVDLKKFRLRPGTIQIEVLDPIPTLGVGPERIDELIATARARMQEAFDRIKTTPVNDC